MTIFKTIQHQIHHFFIALQRIIQSIVKASARIFSPSDDQYPATGVQPFTGDPADKKKKQT